MANRLSAAWPASVAVLALCAGGCTAPAHGPAQADCSAGGSTPAACGLASAPRAPLPEDLLLDVGIRPFDGSAATAAAAELRRAEGAYLAVGLRDALQAAGEWGAVRVVSRPSAAIDLAVVAQVERSDGGTLALRVRATDARGRQWLDDSYRGTATAAAYAHGARGGDPFATVYAAVAGDLARRLLATPRAELASIRAVAALRFADQLLPGEFAGYLRDSDGVLAARRLPAAEDPLFRDARRLSSREHMFIDTVDEYFTGFQHRVRRRYSDWRRSSLASTATRQDLLAEVRARELLGAIHVLSGIADGDVSAKREDRAGRRRALRRLLDGAGQLAAAARKRDAADAEAAAAQTDAASAGAEMLPATLDLENNAANLASRFAEEYGRARQALLDRHAAPHRGGPQRPATPTPRPEVFAAIAERQPAQTPATPVDAEQAPGAVAPRSQLPPVDSGIREQLAAAVRLVDAGRLDAAFGILDSLAESGRSAAYNGRERAHVHSALAFAHYRSGDVPRASAALDAVLAQAANISRPRLAAASLALARLRFEAEQDALAWQAMRDGLSAAGMQQTACMALCSPAAQAQHAAAEPGDAPGDGCAARRSGVGWPRQLDARFRRQLDAVRGQIDAGQPAAALAAIDGLLRQHAAGPEHSLLQRYKASAHSALGNVAQAIQAYEKMLEGPGFVPPGAESRTLYDLAHLHLAQGNHRRSLCYQRRWLHRSKFAGHICRAACPKGANSALAVQGRH